MRRFLEATCVCYWENQVPGLYSKEPPDHVFPPQMVAACREGAGGGNLRHFVCSPDGKIHRSFRGFLRPASFIANFEGRDLVVAEPDLRETLRTIAEEVYTKGRTG